MTDATYYANALELVSSIMLGVLLGYFFAKKVVLKLWRKFHDWNDKEIIRTEMLKQQRYRDLYEEVLTEDINKQALKAAKSMERQYKRSGYR